MRNGSEQNRYNDISTKALSDHLAKIYEEDLSYFAQNDNELLEDLLERNVCKGGHSTFSIDSYGRLYPCLLAPYSAGNICEESFEKIWRDSSVLKQWRNIKFKDIPICNRCKLISKCTVCPVIQTESLFDKEQFTKAAAYGSCNRCATGPAQIY
jgi:radical SAM protein with 4Fe4S-binding SPASM domain